MLVKFVLCWQEGIKFKLMFEAITEFELNDNLARPLETTERYQSD